MHLHIYDGLNYIRRAIDKDPMGRAPRSIITRMLNPQPGSVHVWAFEGKHSLRARRDIYPDYKSGPSSAPSGLFALVDLIRDALGETYALQLDVPGFEADDVIAKIVNSHNGRGYPIKIHTTDRDLNQLIGGDVSSDANEIKNVSPDQVRLYKTFVGDPSDTIPGLKGFGDGSWRNCDKNLLKVAFDSNIEELYVKAGMTPSLAARAVENHELLQKFWTIVGFIDTGPLDSYMRIGKNNAAEADRILKQFNH